MIVHELRWVKQRALFLVSLLASAGLQMREISSRLKLEGDWHQEMMDGRNLELFSWPGSFCCPGRFWATLCHSLVPHLEPKLHQRPPETLQIEDGANEPNEGVQNDD